LSEAKNLVPETAYLNAGALKNTNSSNKKSMLYYETQLAHWLKQNKDYRLDYQVTPMYRNNELLPRQIRLAYVVYINNDSPNAIIDYSNGTARNTLNKTKTLKEDKEAADKASSEAAVKSSAESVARESSTRAAAQQQQEQDQTVVVPDATPVTADGTVNSTDGYKWAIQDGFNWQTRKGHSTRIAPGGSLPAGFHWQVQ